MSGKRILARKPGRALRSAVRGPGSNRRAGGPLGAVASPAAPQASAAGAGERRRISAPANDPRPRQRIGRCLSRGRIRMRTSVSGPAPRHRAGAPPDIRRSVSAVRPIAPAGRGVAGRRGSWAPERASPFPGQSGGAVLRDRAAGARKLRVLRRARQHGRPLQTVRPRGAHYLPLVVAEPGRGGAGVGPVAAGHGLQCGGASGWNESRGARAVWSGRRGVRWAGPRARALTRRGTPSLCDRGGGGAGWRRGRWG